MDLFIVLILLQISESFSKRHHESSSEEGSIENILYYHDCKQPTTNPPVQKLRAESPHFNCPFPKMCCSMSCNGQCDGSPVKNSIGFDSHMGPNFNPPDTHPIPFGPKRSEDNQRGRKPLDFDLQSTIMRRDGTNTKDKIKSLIAQDGDIRKILKELVRVTMQKVDLIEMLHRRSGDEVNNENDEYL